MKTKWIVSLLTGIMILAACEKDIPGEADGKGYSKGILISNEGGYGNSNGSVSYLDRDSMVMQNNLFYQINGRPLGDVVQSVSVHNSRAYIVVNNSQKVEVVDLETFTSLGLIDGFSYPRFFTGAGELKGYVSNGAMEGKVYVIDLHGLQIVDSVDVGFGPEQMLLSGKTLYVANSGGWSNDNTISLINTDTDEVVQVISVGDNPVAMVKDGEGYLWVLCKGRVIWNPDFTIQEETDSELIRLNTETGQVVSRMVIGSKGDYFWPTRLDCTPDGQKILFAEAGGIYQVDRNATQQPSSPVIPIPFYGFGVDPESGNIYGLSAGDFSSAGYLYRFHPDGARIDSMQVGIAPNGLAFY